MTEEWLPIPGYEGRYEVSSEGRVKSLMRATPLIMKQVPDKDGYLTLCLQSARRQQTHKVHCLVLLAFEGPRPDGLQVRHLDGRPTNNKRGNLRYGTSQENTADSMAHGTFNFNGRRGKS